MRNCFPLKVEADKEQDQVSAGNGVFFQIRTK